MDVNTPTLADLEEMVRQAGEIVRAGYNPRPGFGPALEIGYKGEIDLVTEIDRHSEAFLLAEIQRRFPGHSVMAEESGDLTGNLEHRWYIDPVDGTTNFAHGMPFFAVSLAYAEAGALQLGAVYEPLRDECFSAERGAGAWLNGEPIRVSNATQLDHCVLVTGFPYDIRTNPGKTFDHFARFSMLCQAVRRLGSASLDLCYVAAGRLDGYWESQVFSWDIAAAGLLAAEAGATVTDMQGGLDFLGSPKSILAGNPTIHAKMLAVLNE